MKINKRITCIGAGYVGGATMAIIAKKCPEYQVSVVDMDQKRIDEWNSDTIPVYEPGLYEIIKEVRGKNLFFSTDLEQAISINDIIFIAVDTPTKTYGIGEGLASDLKNWITIAHQIRNIAKTDKIIIEKSTLPVKTAESIENILQTGSSVHFEILSNPEFLAEGTAVQDLLNPDRVLIGSRETPTGLKARDELINIYRKWVPIDKIITTNTFSSELSKLVSNTFLAQRLSTINAVSAICDSTEADIEEVTKAVAADSRIGDKFLKSGIGFGGSCFKKDILSLVYISKMYHLDFVANYFENIIHMNTYQQHRFVINVIKSMFNSVAGQKICIFGAAFKPNTNDTRESPSIFIAKKLLEEKSNLVISDPKALEKMKEELKDTSGTVSYIQDPYEAVKGCNAIIIITEWEQYINLDYNQIYKNMIKPAFLFDGRNIVDRENCFKIGFNVYSIGKKSLIH
ncbi:UDP-glucose 6-dehydrogenase [Candidatus Magnetomorum sp. HK-1]|nr:UDP-glucose 6-dehydrogenase [Candidatus Magnetomorum sp. HK-1]